MLLYIFTKSLWTTVLLQELSYVPHALWCHLIWIFDILKITLDGDISRRGMFWFMVGCPWYRIKSFSFYQLKYWNNKKYELFCIKNQTKIQMNGIPLIQ